MDVDEECRKLVEAIERVGEKGKKSCTFGELFGDDEVQNTFEAINGTLRAAKRKKMIRFNGEMLLQGVHDDAVIEML